MGRKWVKDITGNSHKKPEIKKYENKLKLPRTLGIINLKTRMYFISLIDKN